MKPVKDLLKGYNSMKKRTLSLLLAMLMGLSSISAFAEAPAPGDPALATVNGVDILKSEVDALIPAFVDYQYIADASDYRTVLDTIIQRTIIMKKIKELGFDQFTGEETAAFAQEAQTQWESYLASYADYSQSEDTEEARAAALVQAGETLKAAGMSLESVAKTLKEDAAMDRMNQYLIGDYQPSEEEIQGVFQQYGAAYQQTYQNDIQQYEMMTRYSGQTSWYTPEGYRGIVHILLSVDEALITAYSNLSATYEEQQIGDDEVLPLEAGQEPVETAFPEAKPVETVTQEMVNQARQAILDANKADIDAIYQSLAQGVSFIDLIKEYGEDPGMTDAISLAEGYPVHKNSIIYDPVFTAAAFSEKMQKPGDVSDPVVGGFGIHILMYLRDVPSGLIMTDAIHDEIEEYLASAKVGEAYKAALATWLPLETIVYYQEEIDKASAAAQESIQSPEELPLEAAPENEVVN
jgi:parvulin-like peptidyl-prolyl isomerase